ncbi:MAG: hypothetical protein CMJ18_14285 [Phycisphaeraceae bacterium]|nr:hypothetical protein [Phycisphaeraceae bacterium]
MSDLQQNPAEPGRRTVLLRHVTKGGHHFDWMLEPPGPDAAPERLWTARVRLPSWCWRRAVTLDLQAIGAHRRAYLDYEGPVSGDRGDVRRVDEGRFDPAVWSDDLLVLKVQMGHYRGGLRVQRVAGDHWQAVVEG